MKKILFLFIIPIFVFAGDEADYDIVPRTINFLLFAAIMYYFLANPIKNAYKGRIKNIEDTLNRAKNKAIEAKEKVSQAKQEVENAKIKANELIEIGKKQANDLALKLEKEANNEITAMVSTFEEQKEFAKKEATKKVVLEVIEEIFDNKNVKINRNDFVDLLIKKVS